MQYCEICGTLNFKEQNYCTHCGNKLIHEHVCPYCGEVNRDYDTHCRKCKSQINPIEINDFDVLFSQYNIDLLENTEITDEYYYHILNLVFMRANYVEVYGNTTKNKILNFASVFAECRPKSRGYERGFINPGNAIYYDDRLDDSVQISTIIHELAHYFLFTIIENLLCSIFSVSTSSTLQAFIWHFITLPEFRIMNEYCAHTVEGRFIPFGHQNYGSFNVLIRNMGLKKEDVNDMVVFGNTFANEIIIYLEKYIDEELRQEIKLQYKKDAVEHSYEEILTESGECWPLSFKNRTLIHVLHDVFKEASQNDEIFEKLEGLKEIIEGE